MDNVPGFPQIFRDAGLTRYGAEPLARYPGGRLPVVDEDYPAHLLAREPAPAWDGEGAFALWHFSTGSARVLPPGRPTVGLGVGG